MLNYCSSVPCILTFFNCLDIAIEIIGYIIFFTIPNSASNFIECKYRN